MLYNLTKALHIMSLVLWLGGLIHAMSLTPRAAAPVLRRAVHPGAMLTVLTGFIMAFWQGWFTLGWWLPMKLALVLCLIPISLSLKAIAENSSNDSDQPLVGMGFRWGVFSLIFAIVFLALQKYF